MIRSITVSKLLTPRRAPNKALQLINKSGGSLPQFCSQLSLIVRDKKMNLIKFVLILPLVLLASCSVQKTYYDADLSVAADDERRGNYKEAHNNLVSAVWRAKNHLGPKEVSTAYYNLGTFYRRRANFAQSVSALEESIIYAEKAGVFDSLAMGRRYIEIATSHAALNQWNQGVPYIKKVIPIKSKYSGKEAEFVALVFREYVKGLKDRGLDATFISNK